MLKASYLAIKIYYFFGPCRIFKYCGFILPTIQIIFIPVEVIQTLWLILNKFYVEFVSKCFICQPTHCNGHACIKSFKGVFKEYIVLLFTLLKTKSCCY